MTQPIKKSDLGVRTLSAVVMVAVAGAALWLGGWVWKGFVLAVALGVLWEWRALVAGFQPSPVKRGLWNVAGLLYVGIACVTLVLLRQEDRFAALVPVVLVIVTDVFAYFTGRSFGGPKIAPRISPSKTWSGLIGGMTAAALAALAVAYWFGAAMPGYSDNLLGFIGDAAPLMALAAFAAVVAQTGDFFESWMKRRAGVKDSGKLIPGHGGLFDRLDGLLAVLFCFGLFGLANMAAYILLPYPQ